MNFSIDYTNTEEKIVLDTDRHNNSLERLISKLLGYFFDASLINSTDSTFLLLLNK